jgi:hypothetical protein
MKQYKIKNFSKHYLETHGFRYNTTFSNQDETYYSILFSACKWQDYIVLTGEIRVCIETGEVWIDIYDSPINRTRYAPYYYTEYGNFDPVIEIVNKNIQKKCEELNITEVKHRYEKRNSNNKNQICTEQRRTNSRTSEKNNKRGLDRSQVSRGRKPKER